MIRILTGFGAADFLRWCACAGVVVFALTGCQDVDPDQAVLDEPVGEEEAPDDGDGVRGGVPTPERIAALEAVLEEELGGFAPAASDRAAWEGFPLARGEVLARADRYLGRPIPGLTDALYREFRRSGERQSFERPYRERSERACAFALAEALEYRGRYLAPLKESIEAILAEPCWVIPASDRASGLSAYEGQIMDVDLGTAMRAATLGAIVSWLGEELGEDLVGRIRGEVRRRAIDPYLAGVYEGSPACRYWLNNTNNWNAVCHAGVVYATLALEPDIAVRAKVVAGAEAHIGNFLRGFSPDGYCSEGINYWNYGFGHFTILAERLLKATGGQVDLFKHPVVPAVAAFPERMELADGIYAAFSDSPWYARPEHWLEQVLSSRFDTGNVRTVVPSKGSHPLGGMLYETDLTLAPPPAEGPRISTPGGDALRGYFPEAGVLVSRPHQPSVGLAAAMKGGHNDEHHNQNDVGSYVVTANGKLVLVDPGTVVYNSRTFGPHRYENPVLNSYGHPVPRIDNQLQPPGREHRAEVLAADFSPDEDRFSLDLRRAYAVEGLESLTREFVFRRDGDTSLLVRDTFAAARPLAFETALVTFGRARRTGENTLWVEDDSGAAVTVHVETGGLPWEFADEVLEADMIGRRQPRRLAIALAKPQTNATIACAITPLRPESRNRVLDPETLPGSGELERIPVRPIPDTPNHTHRAEPEDFRGVAEIAGEGRFFVLVRCRPAAGEAVATLRVNDTVPEGAEAGFLFPAAASNRQEANASQEFILARNDTPFRIAADPGTLEIALRPAPGLKIEAVHFLQVRKGSNAKFKDLGG